MVAEDSFNERKYSQIVQKRRRGGVVHTIQDMQQANGWLDDVMARKLPTLFEGEASANWLRMTEEEQEEYKISKEKITDKIKPIKFVSLDEHHQHLPQLEDLSKPDTSPGLPMFCTQCN